MFSQISRNWAGRPLTDHETVVNYISTTRTKTGLLVDAHLVQADYPTGVKVSDKEMKDLSVRHHDTQPSRNYTITRPIKKGRLGKPVELGRKAQVTEGSDGIVVDYEVFQGNPPGASPPTTATARPPSTKDWKTSV